MKRQLLVPSLLLLACASVSPRFEQDVATTFAQDEASCIVYGMPKAAWENGAAQLQLPLDRISTYLTGRFDAAHRSVSTAAATP